MKKTTGELKDGMRSFCTFLNTASDCLFFGITPTTLKILLQEVTDNTRNEIAREIAKLEPLIDLPVEYIDVPNCSGCQVIAKHQYTNNSEAHTYRVQAFTFTADVYSDIKIWRFQKYIR